MAAHKHTISLCWSSSSQWVIDPSTASIQRRWPLCWLPTLWTLCVHIIVRWTLSRSLSSVSGFWMIFKCLALFRPNTFDRKFRSAKKLLRYFVLLSCKNHNQKKIQFSNHRLKALLHWRALRNAHSFPRILFVIFKFDNKRKLTLFVRKSNSIYSGSYLQFGFSVGNSHQNLWSWNWNGGR